MGVFRFESLPWFVRQSGVAALGWRNRKLRLGAEYGAWTRFLGETRAHDAVVRRTWQRKRLLSLLESVRAGTPHYAKVLQSSDTMEGCLELEALLQSIPLLEKADIRANPSDFANARVKRSSVSSTSGSTGSPMHFGHDAQSIQRRFALLHDHLRLAGVDPGAPSVRLSGRVLCKVGEKQSRPWLTNPAENQLFLSSYHLDASHADTIAKKLQKYRPIVLDGYPSGILETLRLLDRQGQRLDSLVAIITTAETLHPALRKELVELSSASVMDYYAASEGVPFIQQCPHGTYHVRWQSGIFEVRNGDGVSLAGSGELVCTSFVQDRTPLIRYCTGDLVEGLTEEHVDCPCGLHTQVVNKVLGRVEDMVYTPDGRSLGMFTYRTLKAIDGLGETQVIQHDYAEFEVNSVCDASDEGTISAQVKGSFERALGYPVSVRFRCVDRIPRGANGKVRLVISKLGRKAPA